MKIRSHAILLTACLGVAHLAQAQPTACRAESEQAAPLLELYTSEGCSSCPPADRWFSELVAADTPLDVVPLSFHVDYWDYLGWKDRFAHPAHEQRQRARVRAAGERVVYTPQVMLGTQTRVDWRNRADLVREVARLRASPAPAGLELRATRTANGFEAEVGATPTSESTRPGLQLELVLYSNGLVSDVAAGENRAVVLRHDRVARQRYGPWPLVAGRGARATVPILLPPESGTATGLVAIVSGPTKASVAWALDLPLAGCERAPEARAVATRQTSE